MTLNGSTLVSILTYFVLVDFFKWLSDGSNEDQAGQSRYERYSSREDGRNEQQLEKMRQDQDHDQSARFTTSYNFYPLSRHFPPHSNPSFRHHYPLHASYATNAHSDPDSDQFSFSSLPTTSRHIPFPRRHNWSPVVNRDLRVTASSSRTQLPLSSFATFSQTPQTSNSEQNTSLANYFSKTNSSVTHSRSNLSTTTIFSSRFKNSSLPSAPCYSLLGGPRKILKALRLTQAINEHSEESENLVNNRKVYIYKQTLKSASGKLQNHHRPASSQEKVEEVALLHGGRDSCKVTFKIFNKEKDNRREVSQSLLREQEWSKNSKLAQDEPTKPMETINNDDKTSNEELGDGFLEQVTTNNNQSYESSVSGDSQLFTDVVAQENIEDDNVIQIQPQLRNVSYHQLTSYLETIKEEEEKERGDEDQIVCLQERRQLPDSEPESFWMFICQCIGICCDP